MTMSQLSLPRFLISFADVAASGGYYIATGGCRILANEATLTGSIGVIAGKFNLQKLLDRIGITSDSVEKGARSGWASPTRPFASDEAAAIREQMRDFYEDLFLPKVAASREQSIGNVRKLAEGRVWTGRQAIENGLVDSVGGIREAVQLARKKAGLQEQRHRIVRYTTSRSLLDILPGRAVPSLSIDRVLALMPEDLNVS